MIEWRNIVRPEGRANRKIHHDRTKSGSFPNSNPDPNMLQIQTDDTNPQWTHMKILDYWTESADIHYHVELGCRDSYKPLLIINLD